MGRKFYKYYISYLKEDGEVYAYTDDKKLAKKFKRTRNPDLFLHKVCQLTSEDLHELHIDYPGALIKVEPFLIEGVAVDIPLTQTESITVMNYSAKLIVELPSVATINPDIFSDEVYEALKTIGYVDCYKYFNGLIDDLDIEVDKLEVFHRLYPNMLNLKGGNMLETLSVLLDRY